MKPENLYSERLTLRTPAKSDIDRIYELVSVPSILHWTGIPFRPYEREHAVRFVSLVHAGHRKSIAWHWSIRWRDTDELIGMVSLYRSMRGPTTAEIGCWLGKRYWRRGVMSEAFELVFEYAFRTLKLERVQAHVFAGNKRSSGMVKSLGFVKEGYLRRTRKVRGTWRDEEVWGMLKSDWKSRRR